MAGADTLKATLNTTTSKITWTDASPFFGTSQNLDPILATDPTTGTTIAGGDTGACSVMFRSTNDGTSWLPTAPCTGTYDHPTVAWAPSATNPGAHVWYYCQQGPDEHNCTTSTDDGVTWLPGTTTGLLTCIGIHGHLRAAADGTAYLPGKSCFDADANLVVGGEMTQDDGATWTEYTIPGATSSVFDPAVTATPDGTVYEAWEDGVTSHPVLASSHDHGLTWSPTVDLASTVTPALVASSFPTLMSGDNGRLAYSFLGTSVGTGNPNASGFHGVWYLYTSYSYDGGVTWTTVKDTPTPVQYGEIDGGGTTTTGQRNLLDFIDSSVTKDGRLVIAFADGCLADCEAAASTSQASAEALSTHAFATLAWQTSGRGLFSAYDVVLPASAPVLSATSGSSVGLTWTPPTDDGGGAITGYRVYRSTGGGTPVLVGSPSGTSYTDTSAVRGTTYSYVVKAVNSAGEGAASNAASGVAFTVPGAPVLSVTAVGSAAHLTWTLAEDGGSAVTGYQVLRGTASGAETLLTTTTARSYDDSAPAAGQTYYYKVTATNAAGTSPSSGEVAFSGTAPPGAPLLSATTGKGTVKLTWTAPSSTAPITGYQIWRGSTAGGEVLVQTISSGTSYIDAVPGGATYYYRVAATNAAGAGAPSNEVAATPKK
jgi:fibronectin type 3 domain-containing protein